MYRECADKRQEIMTGMEYWAKADGINIDTAVLFFNLVTDEMVKTKLNPGSPVAMYKNEEIDMFTIDGDTKNYTRG